MAEMFNIIWSWLEIGYSLASIDEKLIWNETKAIFKMATDALRSISNKFQSLVSYSQEKSWKEENGAVVKVC